MEVAASAFATASIAKELGVGVKKLIEFWTSIEEAPNDVREIVDELNLLCDVFKDIESEAKQDTENATVKKILENCKLIIKQLESITHNLERGFASSKRLTRKWTAIKGALKCKQLDKFQTTLGRLKHTLTLALQTRTSRTLHLQFQHQQQILVALTGCVSRPTVGNPSTLNRLITYDEHSGRGLPNVESGYKTGKIAKSDIASSVTIGSHLQPDEPGVDLQNLRATSEPKTITMYPKNALSSKLWSTRLLSAENFQRKSIYGCLRVQSAQRVLELAEEEDWVDIGNRFESRTSIVVRPAAWMSRIGINYGFQVDISRCVTQGWKYTLSSVCTVPDNALIFQACEKGDIPIVRGLLARGEASARDTNSYGLTPLHYAAESHCSELCRLLIHAGADRMAQSDIKVYDGNRTPLAMASRSFCSNDIQLNSVIDTIRLFLDCVDFSDSSCDGWNVAMNFACHFNGKSNDYAKIYILFEWIIIQFQQEMKDNPNPGIYASMSNYVCRAEDPNALQLWRDLAPQSAFKQKGRYEFQILAPQLVGESSEIAHFLSRGADASCAGINEDISPRPETLTSLAMYSIQAFQNWTGNISEARIDIDAVLAHESKEGPVHEAGWTLETLQKLYEFSEVNCACGDSYDCCICKKKIGQNGLKIQPLWLYAQEKIKCGNLPQRKTFRDFFEEARAESSGEMSKNLEERSEEEDGEDFTEELDDSSIDIEEAEAFLSDLDKRYEERLSKKLPTGLLVLGRWPEAALDPMDLETARSKPVEEWPSYAYRRSDRVRMQCWLAHPHLHMGNWKKVAVTSESDTDAYTGMSSQDEFSPYLIHS